MRIILILFLTLSFFGNEFKSYDAKFAFETKFGDFPLKRYFTAKDNEINTLRYYGVGAQIIKDFKIKNMILISRSKKKIIGLEGFDLRIKKQIIVK